MADVKFATPSGHGAVVSRAEVERFRGALRGVSLLPGDEGYDRVRRLWNAIRVPGPRVTPPRKAIDRQGARR